MLIYCLTTDLFYRSKIEGTAKACGVTVEMVPSVDDFRQLCPTPPTIMLLDLHHPDALNILGLCKERVISTIGFAAHTDTATLTSARAAGCQLVLPKSAFFQRLPSLLR